MFNDVSVPSLPLARNPHRPVFNKKVLHGLFMIAFAALTLVQSTGCNLNKLAFTDAWMLSYRDAVWSRRAFNLNYGNCDQPYAEHFEEGFCAGYQDVAGGGDGYVPAMPPNEYRGFEYQSAEGAQCVNAWFEGYPAGVAAARKDDVGTYHNVLISRMINAAVTQSETEHKLPGDVPIISPEMTRSSIRPSKPMYTVPPVTPTQPVSNSTPFPRSQPFLRTPTSLPTSTQSAPPAPPAQAIENSQTSVEYIYPEARVAESVNLPPIVTGSGVMPQQPSAPNASCGVSIIGNVKSP